MSTLSNSESFSTFQSSGLPDELSPAARQQFIAECNQWHDERRAAEAEAMADQDEYAYWHARAEAESKAFHAELQSHIDAMRRISGNVAEITRAIA